MNDDYIALQTERIKSATEKTVSELRAMQAQNKHIFVCLKEIESHLCSIKEYLIKEKNPFIPNKIICPRCKGEKRTLVYSKSYSELNHVEPCKYCLGEGFIK
jgi:hypothetical protein